MDLPANSPLARVLRDAAGNMTVTPAEHGAVYSYKVHYTPTDAEREHDLGATLAHHPERDRATLKEGLSPIECFLGELAGYAAFEAARTLADNWADAIRDNEPEQTPAETLRQVFHDVDDTIMELLRWREHLLAGLAKLSP